MVFRTLKKYFIVVLSIICFSYHSFSAFSVDGKTLSELALAQRFSLSKRAEPEDTNITLRMVGRDLQIGELCQKDLDTQITDIYRDLESQTEQIATLKAEENINIKTEKGVCFQGSFAQSGQSVFLSGLKIELGNSIVQAGDEIRLIGSEFKFENAFFSCKKGIMLQALPESKGILRSIKYIFSDKNPFGCLINGSFKFEELPVISSHVFFAFGAEQIILELDQNL